MNEILTAEDFQTQRREMLLEYDNYYEEADDLLTSYTAAQKNLSNPEWMAKSDAAKKVMVAAAAAEFSADLLTLSYSAGVNLGNFALSFRQLLRPG